MPFAAAKRGHGAYLQNPHFTFDSNSNVATKRHIKHKMKDKQKESFVLYVPCGYVVCQEFLAGTRPSLTAIFTRSASEPAFIFCIALPR